MYRAASQTLSKALDISRPTARVAILSDITARRSAVDREDLKPYLKSEKRSHLSGDKQAYCLQAFQRLYLPTTKRE